MNKGHLEQFEQSIRFSEGPEDESGFVENFNAAFDVFMDEETSISRFLNNGMYEERDRQLDELISAGEVDNVEQYRELFGYDYTKMAYDLKHKGFAVLDDYDVRNNVRATLAQQRLEAQEIHERASGMGTVGQFTGMMAAAQLDPINIGSMFIPGLGMVRQGTTMARVGKAAAYYAGTGAAAETLIQPVVKSWKNELALEYTAGDMFTNIALAAVAEGTLGTALELGVPAVKNGFKGLRERVKANEPEPEALLREIDHFEAEYDWHVRSYRRAQVLDKVERLKALQQELYAMNKKNTELDELIEEYTKDEFQKWMEEADMIPVESADDIYEEFIGQAALFLPDESANDATHIGLVRGLDAENSAVARAMDEVKTTEELSLQDEAPGDVFANYDEDAYMDMTPEQQSQYVSELLGEIDPDEEVMWETGHLDADGNMQYAARSAEDIKLELDEESAALQAFTDCWGGKDE